jgi:hypothetical protein
MSAIDPRLSRWLVWIAPFAVLALAIGLQTGWGGELRRAPPADAPVAPAPVATAVMPEYRIDGGAESMRAMVERPLFNVTRRPAPTPAAEEAKATMQRGQFLLTGTMIVDKVAVAFLKESGPAGKSRSVKAGDAINGMRVASVEPDRVRLTLGDESEDVELKVQKGPKVTVQAPPAEAAPPPAAAQAAAQPARAPVAQSGAPRAPGRGTRSQGAGGQPGSDAADNLRQNRRNARAQEGQQRGAQGDGSSQAAPNTPQGSWDNVYRNMQRPAK